MRSHARKSETTKRIAPFGTRKIPQVAGSITEEQFWKELQSINMSIHDDDRKIIRALNPQPWDDYVAFYFEIKQMKTIAAGDGKINDDADAKSLAVFKDEEQKAPQSQNRSKHEDEKL